MFKHARWLILAILAVTVFAATGCASSRNGRYGRNGGYYPGVYDQRGGIYRDRDYRWEQRQRERQRREWLREQRRRERYERDRYRNRSERDRRYDRRY